MDENYDLRKWREGDAFVGTLAKPFPFTIATNDLTGLPADSLAKEEPLEEVPSGSFLSRLISWLRNDR